MTEEPADPMGGVVEDIDVRAESIPEDLDEDQVLEQVEDAAREGAKQAVLEDKVPRADGGTAPVQQVAVRPERIAPRAGLAALGIGTAAFGGALASLAYQLPGEVGYLTLMAVGGIGTSAGLVLRGGAT